MDKKKVFISIIVLSAVVAGALYVGSGDMFQGKLKLNMGKKSVETVAPELNKDVVTKIKKTPKPVTEEDADQSVMLNNVLPTENDAESEFENNQIVTPTFEVDSNFPLFYDSLQVEYCPSEWTKIYEDDGSYDDDRDKFRLFFENLKYMYEQSGDTPPCSYKILYWPEEDTRSGFCFVDSMTIYRHERTSGGSLSRWSMGISCDDGATLSFEIRDNYLSSKEVMNSEGVGNFFHKYTIYATKIIHQ